MIVMMARGETVWKGWKRHNDVTKEGLEVYGQWLSNAKVNIVFGG